VADFIKHPAVMNDAELDAHIARLIPAGRHMPEANKKLVHEAMFEDARRHGYLLIDSDPDYA